jgi:hypothetical protein
VTDARGGFNILPSSILIPGSITHKFCVAKKTIANKLYVRTMKTTGAKTNNTTSMVSAL